MTDAFDKVTFRGRLMDRKTKAFLLAMEDKLGYQLTVVQGCYNPGGVSASAGTHDGGGVVDLAAWDWENKVRVARELGAFAWHRDDLPGVWGEHIHLGIRNHGRLSPAAQEQQRDYDARPARDGLANDGLDPTWHPKPPVVFAYPVTIEPKPVEATHVSQARDALVEVRHSLSDAIAHLGDADASRKVAKNLLDDVRGQRRAVNDVLDQMPKR